MKSFKQFLHLKENGLLDPISPPPHWPGYEPVRGLPDPTNPWYDPTPGVDPDNEDDSVPNPNFDPDKFPYDEWDDQFPDWMKPKPMPEVPSLLPGDQDQDGDGIPDQDDRNPLDPNPDDWHWNPDWDEHWDYWDKDWKPDLDWGPTYI